MSVLSELKRKVEACNDMYSSLEKSLKAINRIETLPVEFKNLWEIVRSLPNALRETEGYKYLLDDTYNKVSNLHKVELLFKKKSINFFDEFITIDEKCTFGFDTWVGEDSNFADEKEVREFVESVCAKYNFTYSTYTDDRVNNADAIMVDIYVYISPKVIEDMDIKSILG